MNKKIVSLIALFVALAASKAGAVCNLQFSAGGSPPYAPAQFSMFIEQQIRPPLSSGAGTFEIDVMKTCPGVATTRLQILMDQTDYYLVNIQGHLLAPQESIYQTSPLTLSEPNLEAAIDAAASFAALPLPQKQNTVKILAYFLAESARFAAIERIDMALLNGQCAAEWLNYATLVRRWSVLSQFALHVGPHDWSAQGGSGGHLVAPVSDMVVGEYEAAIAAGPAGPNARYVDRRDQGGAQIQVPGPTCQP